MSKKNFMLSWVKHDFFFYNFGASSFPGDVRNGILINVKNSKTNKSRQTLTIIVNHSRNMSSERSEMTHWMGGVLRLENTSAILSNFRFNGGVGIFHCTLVILATLHIQNRLTC